MSSDGKFFLTVVIAAVLVIAGIVFFSSKNKPNLGGDTVNVDTTVGHRRGGSDAAPVKVVEFGDFQCPACGAAEPEVQKMLAANPDVQFIFRNFPLPIHPNAEPAAKAAEAAEKQGKYWEMHDLLYSRQTAWQGLSNPDSVFVGYATELGLDTKKFQSDYGANATLQTIKDDFTYGESLKVDQTPTFFVNGKRVLGVQSAADWQQLIADAKK